MRTLRLAVAAAVLALVAPPAFAACSSSACQAMPDQAKKDFAAGRFQVPAAACAGVGDPSPCCTAAATGATCPTYKMALHTSTATCGTAATTQAGLGGEVAAAGGYSTGGAAMPGFALTVASNHANVAYTSPVSWSSATITARMAAIYCATNCQALDVVGCYCLDGGSCGADTVSTGGTFSVTVPSPVYQIAMDFDGSPDAVRLLAALSGEPVPVEYATPAVLAAHLRTVLAEGDSVFAMVTR